MTTKRKATVTKFGISDWVELGHVIQIKFSIPVQHSSPAFQSI